MGWVSCEEDIDKQCGAALDVSRQLLRELEASLGEYDRERLKRQVADLSTQVSQIREAIPSHIRNNDKLKRDLANANKEIERLESEVRCRRGEVKRLRDKLSKDALLREIQVDFRCLREYLQRLKCHIWSDSKIVTAVHQIDNRIGDLEVKVQKQLDDD
jgi:septal ring factor EnvC (AmiA/AmiB activator)